MFRNILVLLFSLSLLVSAQAQYYTIIADSQNPESIVVGPQYSGNTPFIKFKYYDDAVPVDLAPWTMELDLFLSQYDTNGSFQIAGTVSGSTNEAVFLGATNAYLWSRDYYFSIKGTHLSGYLKTMATGKLIIEYDPATSTNVWAQLTQLNINFFSNNVGAQVESNRVRIAVFETSKVSRVAFDGTNLIFEGRIGSNEAFNVLQALTNTAIDVRLSAEEAATTNQAATNALKVDIATFTASVAYAISAGDTALWHQASADGISATSDIAVIHTSTGAWVQAVTDSADWTNNPLSWSNAVNLTNNVKWDTASTDASAGTNFLGTNTLQTQITANQTNQAATNVAVQVQIAAVSSADLYRYDAYSAVANTIWVFATSTNITAVRAGSVFTFTIAANTKLLAAKIRIDGQYTDSGKIYVSVGTNDMNNSSTVNNWIPVCNATRDDTYANVPVTAITYSGDNSQIVISGLGTGAGVFYHVELRF